MDWYLLGFLGIGAGIVSAIIVVVNLILDIPYNRINS